MSNFNAGLQGLRGIAITLVLLNHFGAPGFDGGFVGVDVFFVISGYLIGGHLLRELLVSGSVDLWAFYARRCRRLLPACLAMLVVIIGAVLWLYAPFEHRELMSSVRASSVYAVNLWLAGRATDYFGGHTEAIPVLHLWSLAVEEQFYIFWPVLMLGAFALWPRNARRSAMRLVVTVGSLSLLACVVVSETKIQWAFYLTPTRIWEFCVGALIAARSSTHRKISNKALTAIGALSFAVLTLTSAVFDSQLRFPGAWAIIPVAAAAGLILVAQQPLDTWPSQILRWKPLCWLGDCSYSVYLWHWPLVVFASVLHPRPSVRVTLAAVALTLILGRLSYRWIELPFKNGILPQWSPQRVVSWAFFLCLAIGVSAHMLGRVELGEQQARFRTAAEWPEATASGCLVLFDAVEHPSCEFGAKAVTATVVLFGDSHAMQWFTPLRALADKHGWRLIVLAKAVCPNANLTVEHYASRKPYIPCDLWREKMFARIEAIRPDIVIAANSSGYAVAVDRWQEGLSRSVERLQATAANVVYLRDTPFANFDVPTCLARAQWRGVRPDALCTFPLALEQQRYGALSKAEADAVRARGGIYLDFPKSICVRADCPTERDGMILYKDRNHITEAFALHLAPELELPLLELLSKSRRQGTGAGGY